MRDIFWTQRAVQDLDSIANQLADNSPDFAVVVEEALLTAADFLLVTSGAGSPVGASGVRKWSVARMPYITLYRPRPHGIEILRVRHARENWFIP